jgi:hypothetical protein
MRAIIRGLCADYDRGTLVASCSLSREPDLAGWRAVRRCGAAPDPMGRGTVRTHAARIVGRCMGGGLLRKAGRTRPNPGIQLVGLASALVAEILAQVAIESFLDGAQRRSQSTLLAAGG